MAPCDFQCGRRSDSTSCGSFCAGMPPLPGLHLNGAVAAQFGAAMGGAIPTAGAVAAGVASAQQIAARLMQQATPGAAPASSAAAGGLDVAQPHYEADLEINDFPQHARWKARFYPAAAD